MALRGTNCSHSLPARCACLTCHQVITLLFLACLTAPELYLCPDDDEGAPLLYFDRDGGESFYTYFTGYFREAFSGLVFSALLTIPVVALLLLDFHLGSLLERNEQLQFERLLVHEVRP